MLVRELRDADVDDARQVLTEAFDDGGEVAALAAALTARPDRPAPPLVAEVDGRVVGYVQLSRSWVDAARRLVPVAVLSPLGVRPGYQGRGVGRALSATAVQQARDLGAPAVFLEGDPAYYSRLGWVAARAQGFDAPSVRIPDRAFQVVILPAWQPWMVGALVYNDTFWSFDCVGLRDPE